MISRKLNAEAANSEYLSVAGDDQNMRFALVQGTHLPMDVLGEGAKMTMIVRNAPAANDPSFGNSERVATSLGKVSAVASRQEAANNSSLRMIQGLNL